MIGIHAYYTLPPEVLEFLRTKGQQELKSLAAHHGLPVWDQAWLEAFTGLKPKPLPEGWQAWPDSPAFLAKYPAQVFPGYDPTKESTIRLRRVRVVAGPGRGPDGGGGDRASPRLYGSG
jgi:hypothetical protein